VEGLPLVLIVDAFDAWRGRLPALSANHDPPNIRPATAADIAAITTIHAHAVKYRNGNVRNRTAERAADRFRTLAE
jgi:hypothetical protein